MALGAFLAGLVVARSEFSVRAASEALPMRDAFAVLFFVSVGMLLDPLQVLDEPRLIVATLAIVLVGKPLAALAIIAAASGIRCGSALAVAVALAQIGEFSFIVANLGASARRRARRPRPTRSSPARSPRSRSIRCSTGWSTRLSTWWSGVGNGPVPADGQPAAAAIGRHQAVVVGYGPVGRTVTRLLRENEIAPTVVELNMDTVQDLKGSGIRAVYGDAGHLATLEQAGARHARSVIFTVSGMRAAEESIRLVRELNPRVQILARTAYLKERDALRKAGADQVFSGEGEVALTLTESILASLGATAEQIDRERARVHGEIN